MKKRIKRFHRSLTYAQSGLQHALATQPNLWIHLMIATSVSIAAYILHFDYLEWSVLILAIGLVIVLELVNTVAELVVDLASPEFSDLARTAKDVAAAAVLIAAITSVIIGVILFGSKL
jgi:undecaprenol kinase